MICAACGRAKCKCELVDAVAAAMERFPYQRPPRVRDHLRREASAFIDRLERQGVALRKSDGPTDEA